FPTVSLVGAGHPLVPSRKRKDNNEIIRRILHTRIILTEPRDSSTPLNKLKTASSKFLCLCGIHKFTPSHCSFNERVRKNNEIINANDEATKTSFRATLIPSTNQSSNSLSAVIP